MIIKDIVKATKLALENMDQNYCKLSQVDYSEIEGMKSFILSLSKEKYLERPFAYEFYHQLRSLMDKGIVDFGEPIIQAEVDKRYQHCFERGKSPDFIIHLPNSKRNLAVIEFKLATRVKEDIKEDFKKIVEFKTNFDLKYRFGIEVILGTKKSLEKRKRDINNWNRTEGEEIIIIEFDTDSWKADHSVIKFKE
jgi:hypothetical protein